MAISAIGKMRGIYGQNNNFALHWCLTVRSFLRRSKWSCGAKL